MRLQHALWLPAVRWCALVALTAALGGTFAALHLSAALLIGAMVAAIVLATCDVPVKMPPIAYAIAQAVIGCMIARVLTTSLFRTMAADWPLVGAAVISVLAAACLLGFWLTRWRVLPGTAAMWGAFPGAATAMVLMAEAYGADLRLVAFMQYLRVVVVAVVASAVAWAVVPAGAAAPAHPAWLASIDVRATAPTFAVAAIGLIAGLALDVPAGAILVPMVLGALLQDTGVLTITLPPVLLAAAYIIVGWSIGLRFSRELLGHVARALARVGAAIAALVLVCAGLSVVLARLGHVDALTAYLAMSPGGADSVAIIAASSQHVDLPFVMALQTARFLVILVVGPRLARFFAERATREPVTRQSPNVSSNA